MERNLRTEEEIMSSWQGEVTKPTVSISCTTFNHEQFIEDALEGFLIQRTEYPFEILIHDDASTDNTQSILLKYQERYPNIIRLILQSENQYSQGRKIGEFLFPEYKGKYVANCEGDDYWTDPKKIQIQVEFLERNPEYVMSCHNASVADENGVLIKDSKLSLSQMRDFSQDDLMSGRSSVLTLSRVYRRQVERVPESIYIKNGDTFFSIVLGLYGKCKFHKNILPGVYRVHTGGIWSLLSEQERLEDRIQTYFWIYRYYKRIGLMDYAVIFFDKYKKHVGDFISKGDVERYKGIDFYASFSSLTDWINLLSQEKSKYLIYGYGSMGRYFESILGSKAIGFIDNKSIEINGNKPVFSIPDIKNITFDAIVVSLIGRESEVVSEIKKELGEESKKIVYKTFTYV